MHRGITHAALTVALALSLACSDDVYQPDPEPCEGCEATSPEGPPEEIGLFTVQGRFEIGGGLADDALWVGALTPGAPTRLEVAVARGGRLEVFKPDGLHLWRSPILGVKSVQAVADLDGDGGLEIVAEGAQAVWIFDGASGALRWALPEAPLGAERPGFVEVGLTLLGDVDGDGLPDLYVTDGSCSRGGTGHAAVYSFAEGWGEAPLAIFDEGRVNGRCTRWNALADIDGDGQDEILITDAEGLKGYDSPSGAQAHCFDVPEPDAGGALPYQIVDALPARPGQELILFRDGVVRLIDDTRCPARAARWAVDLGGALFHRGAGLWDANGDGALDVFVSAFTDAGWVTYALSGDDGAALYTLPGRLAALWDIDGDGRPEALIAEGEGATPPTYATLQALRLNGSWEEAMTFEGALIYPKRRAADAQATPERVGPFGLEGGLVVLQAEAGRLMGAALLTDDALQPIPLEARPSAFAAFGGRGWAMSMRDGGLGIYTGAALENADPRGAPLLRAPSGAATLGAATPELILGLSADQTLFALDLEAEEILWRRAPVTNHGGIMVTPEGPRQRVLAWSREAGGEALIGFDVVSGAEAWRHSLDSTLYKAVDDVALAELPGVTLALRYDVVLEPEGYAPDPTCPPERALDVDEAPDPRCPEERLYLRTLTALDAETGACAWRTLIRPNYNCSSPSNQTISAADADGDGEVEIYLTETDTIRRFDPRDGAQTGVVELGRVSGEIARGGGRVVATGDGGILRYGGNGPPDRFDANLDLAWRAAPPSLELSTLSWVRRAAWVLDGALWATPAARWPLLQYGAKRASPLQSLGFVEGGLDRATAPAPRFSDPIDVQRVERLTRLGAGVLVTDEAGFLYALALDGALRWSRHLGVVIGPPLVIGEGADRRMLVSTDEGHLRVYAPTLAPEHPSAIWEIPCEQTDTRRPEDDIDVADRADALCVEWLASEGAAGHEARIVGENDARITEWVDVGYGPTYGWSDLELIPGQTYKVEIRAYGEVGEHRSASLFSDGVEIAL